MYRGIVELHFRFCCSTRGCCLVTKLQTSQRLQNRAASTATKGRLDTPAKALIQSLNWLTIRDLIRSETATIMYHSPSGLFLAYFSNFFGKMDLRCQRTEKHRKRPFATFTQSWHWGKGLFLFVDLSFGIALNLILNRHPFLSTLRKESRIKYHKNLGTVIGIWYSSLQLVNFLPKPPEKPFSWTDEDTLPKWI